MGRSEFIQHLFDLNLLWSYDRSSTDQLPEVVVIEHVLLYGDVPELQTLFKLYEKEEIQKVWVERLVPHQSNHKINMYLGTFFFGIPDIREFLKQRIVEHPRLERLRLLAAGDKGDNPEI